MAFKFVTFAALFVVARAGVLAPLAAPAPLAYHPAAPAPIAYAAAAPVAKLAAAPIIAKTVVAEEFDAHPQYSYGYGVDDHLTGDSKSQHEVRDGDVVQGSYSLIDADGTRRIVDYTADDLHGFNAVVRKEPLGASAVVAKTVAAPIAKVATPIAAAAYIH